MKVAVFSDIHGNLPAFELALKKMGGVDMYVSLGDVVNYGPWSNECVELLESLKNSIKILGNHDKYFLHGKFEGNNKLVKTFFDHCIADFKNKTSLKNYKKSYNLGNYTLKHTIVDENYVYPDSKIKLDRNYMIGHSHIQFSLKSGGFTLLCPGSVGQNREYINIINYMILDTDRYKFKMKKLTYDVGIVIKEMEKRKFPKICVDYYKSKKRF